MADYTFYETAASGEDGDVYRGPSAAYPPSGTITVEADYITPAAGKTFFSGQYENTVALLRFDTSSLAGKTIASAVLYLHGYAAYNDDARNLLIDYYASTNWPLDTADYVDLVPGAGSAHVVAMSALGGVDKWQALSLTSPDANINKAGYTGFRMGLSGNQPTGANVFSFQGRTATFPPYLIVSTSGYQHKPLGCLPSAVAKIIGVATSSVAKFNGA